MNSQLTTESSLNIDLTEEAFKVYWAVVSSPGQIYRFGYEKLAFVAHLPDTEVRKAVCALRMQHLLITPVMPPGRRQVFVAKCAAFHPPFLDNSEREMITRLVRIDFDLISHEVKFRPLQFDESQGVHVLGWSPYDQLSDTPEIECQATSSLRDYLNYILFGAAAFEIPSTEWQCIQTNWTLSIGLHARDITHTDARACTQYSLAGYWGWCVGYQRAAHGVALVHPDFEAIAVGIDNLIRHFNLAEIVGMLNYAAANWSALVHSQALAPSKYGRLPTQRCWEDPAFAYEVHRRVTSRLATPTLFQTY